MAVGTGDTVVTTGMTGTLQASVHAISLHPLLNICHLPPILPVIQSHCVVCHHT